MTEKEIERIAEAVGLEQILIDAEITVEYLLMILHESGYIDLDIYLEEIYND